jgi:KipI family sensor histidine kinase inhibitor
VTGPAGARPVRVAPAGDAALVLEFPSRIDPSINAAAVAAAEAVGARWGAILRDVVVGFSTVTVYYDPLRVDASWLEDEVWQAASQGGEDRRDRSAFVEVPVCYDPSLGPDLGEVATFAGCTPEEVVARHAGRQYRVYMVGFVPGFAYLAEVDPVIAAPRRAVPRTLVPAGAVGIAGRQTGVYPSETPGGWNIIGRTRFSPWDPARALRSVFRPGDVVQFVPIPRDVFDRST